MNRIKQIYEFYKIYDENFVNRKYVYYSNENILTIEFIKKNKLAVRNLSEKNDGSSLQKMQVYNQFGNLKNKTNLVLSNNEVMNLNLDGIIATNKKILAIGVRDSRPITLLNQKPKFNMGTFEKVNKIEI